MVYRETARCGITTPFHFFGVPTCRFNYFRAARDSGAIPRTRSDLSMNRVTPLQTRACERRVCDCLHALLDFAAVATQNDAHGFFIGGVSFQP